MRRQHHQQLHFKNWHNPLFNFLAGFFKQICKRKLGTFVNHLAKDDAASCGASDVAPPAQKQVKKNAHKRDGQPLC